MTAHAKKLEPAAAPLGWLARDEKGDVITRQAHCECGRIFTQSMLNPSFVDAKPNIAREFMRQIPDGYVPVFCPRCESKDLGRTRVQIP